MYSEGNILYFDPFYFKNGNTAKRKYFLVLKKINENAIIASLPSSIPHLPPNIDIQHGCIEIPESCINCYVFEMQRPITKNGWYFELHTFLHGNWLDDFDLNTLSQTYQIEGIDYEILGQLTVDELEKVKNCFRNSNTVKRKYKRIL